MAVTAAVEPVSFVFAAAGIEGGDAAEVSEGGLVAEALGVVAGGNEENRGALGADAGPGRERRWLTAMTVIVAAVVLWRVSQAEVPSRLCR